LIEMLVMEEHHFEHAPKALHRSLRAHFDYLRKQIKQADNDLDREVLYTIGRAHPDGVARLESAVSLAHRAQHQRSGAGRHGLHQKIARGSWRAS
jgi:hypothetical protein